MSNGGEDEAAHARQTAESSGSNLVDQVLVEIQRVEMYYHNDTDGSYPRCMFPYSTDSIRMQAIVWARPRRRGGAQFQPCTLPAPPHDAFDYDDHWCSLGAYYPQSQPRGFHPRHDITRPGRPPRVDSWTDHHLDLPDGTQVQNWPGNWPRPQFTWQELVCTTPTGPANRPRDYSYRYRDIPEADVTAEGWAYVRTFPAGTRRFRVKVRLPAQTAGDRSVAASAEYSSTSDAFVSRGFPVHMCVREANLPASVPAAMQEFVRWSTMFLEVPYEVGGHFIGGQAATAAGHPDGYDGCGLDCTGLVSIAGFLAEFGWSPWRRSTCAQNAPTPATRVDPPTDVQPGDVLDRPDHVRIVYDAQVSASDPTDRQVRVIEASSSEAGKVRLTDWRSIRDLTTGTGSHTYIVIRPDTGASSTPAGTAPASSAPASGAPAGPAPASATPTGPSAESPAPESTAPADGGG